MMNAYELARLADCASPDTDQSPGAEWLYRVASGADEIDDQDDIAEVADSAVPSYTHNLWQVFVDLSAYNEDPVGEGLTDGTDMNQTAMVALYMIAERLLGALLADRADA